VKMRKEEEEEEEEEEDVMTMKKKRNNVPNGASSVAEKGIELRRLDEAEA